MGKIVAVTADGTNDIPSLMRASVGIAMGTAGTELCQSAAGIIAVRDSFADIANVVTHEK